MCDDEQHRRRRDRDLADPAGTRRGAEPDLVRRERARLEREVFRQTLQRAQPSKLFRECRVLAQLRFQFGGLDIVEPAIEVEGELVFGNPVVHHSHLLIRSTSRLRARANLVLIVLTPQPATPAASS